MNGNWRFVFEKDRMVISNLNNLLQNIKRYDCVIQSKTE